VGKLQLVKVFSGSRLSEYPAEMKKLMMQAVPANHPTTGM